MTDDDIAKARATIAAASKGPATWTADPNETEDAAFARLRLAFDGGRAITGSTALHTVEVERRDDGTCLVMAITGNGPLAPANAVYIVGSFDPVAGWSAALDEVERLGASKRVKHAQIERLDGEVAKLTADCQRWQVLASQASEVLDRQTSEIERCAKTLAECGVTIDRVATIASEAFGQFPVQGVEANLTAIEQGIAKLRIENAALLEQANSAIRTVSADYKEIRRPLASLARACGSTPLAYASKHAGRVVTVREGDASWHDGPGWYYTIDDCPEEGSCGAFAAPTLAAQHARIAGFVVEPHEPRPENEKRRKAGA